MRIHHYYQAFNTFVSMPNTLQPRFGFAEQISSILSFLAGGRQKDWVSNQFDDRTDCIAQNRVSMLLLRGVGTRYGSLMVKDTEYTFNSITGTRLHARYQLYNSVDWTYSDVFAEVGDHGWSNLGFKHRGTMTSARPACPSSRYSIPVKASITVASADCTAYREACHFRPPLVKVFCLGPGRGEDLHNQSRFHAGLSWKYVAGRGLLARNAVKDLFARRTKHLQTMSIARRLTTY